MRPAVLALSLLTACAAAAGPQPGTTVQDTSDAGVDAGTDAASEVAAPADTVDVIAIDVGQDATAADVAPSCQTAGCPPASACLADGSCCVPACTDKCGGVPDGCGGTCAATCAGVCTVPASAPTPLYRAFAFKPIGAVANNPGCPVSLGVTSDGTRVTDFSNTGGYAAGNTAAIAFAADDLVGKAEQLGLLAGQASGSGCTSGASGCQLKLWASSFSPYGLPGVCPARAVLVRDVMASDATFRQDAKSPVPAFAPLFLFAGPVESLAPWLQVHRLVAVPSTNTALPGVFCGAVARSDLQAALAKLTAQQQQDGGVGLIKKWLQDHEPGVDLDGNGEGDAYPFAFSLGIALAGPSSIAK